MMVLVASGSASAPIKSIHVRQCMRAVLPLLVTSALPLRYWIVSMNSNKSERVIMLGDRRIVHE